MADRRWARGQGKGLGERFSGQARADGQLRVYRGDRNRLDRTEGFAPGGVEAMGPLDIAWAGIGGGAG